MMAMGMMMCDGIVIHDYSRLVELVDLLSFCKGFCCAISLIIHQCKPVKYDKKICMLPIHYKRGFFSVMNQKHFRVDISMPHFIAGRLNLKSIGPVGEQNRGDCF